MSIHKRKRAVPSVKGMPVYVKDISDQVQREEYKKLDEAEALRKSQEPTMTVTRHLPKLPKVHPLLLKQGSELLPHEARKVGLYYIHNKTIPIEDIFVDKRNGVELYRTVSGGWVSDPKYRGGE